MINLLPKAEKKKLLREQRLRLAAVILAIVFFLEFFIAALLSPSYLLLSTNTRILGAELEERKGSASSGASGIEKSLAAYKSEIALLKPGTTTADLPLSMLLNDFVGMKPAGIALYSLAYARTNNVPAIQFSGIAGTRNDLIAFQRAIKENPRVIDMKYDQSFITKKVDIDFRATITLK